MGLNNIDSSKRKREVEIAEQLFSCIDKKQSLVFNAGAGDGGIIVSSQAKTA